MDVPPAIKLYREQVTGSSGLMPPQAFFCKPDGAIVKNDPISRCAFVKRGFAMIFERKIFQEMLKWKEQYAPHYALFLKGARRVGKTTLAEKLGREAYESYILIRFDQADQVVKDLFVNGLRDLDVFFAQLQFEYKTQLYRRKSLIILDEIQFFPQAR